MGREVAHHLHEQHASRLRHDLHEIERDRHEIVVAFILAFAALGAAWILPLQGSLAAMIVAVGLVLFGAVDDAVPVR
jgi:hypothetical protein